MNRLLLVIASVLIIGPLASCTQPLSYGLRPPGTHQIGNLTVENPESWNRASNAAPFGRRGTEIWSQDGILLDRLIVVPQVPDGEPIFKARNKSDRLPVFKAAMLPSEIVELIEASLPRALGVGGSTVVTGRVRPQQYGEDPGILMEVSGSIEDATDYSGLIGAFVGGQKLYLLIHVAAEPYYATKHRARAEALIKSARRRR